jgi:hypothetical protein
MNVTPYTFLCLECHVPYIEKSRAGGPGCDFLILDTDYRRCGCFTTFALRTGLGLITTAALGDRQAGH